MPTPKELLDAGNLKAAIEALTQEVREAPADPQKRTFLFELLAFAGEWDRAEKQIAAAAGADAPSQMAAGVYRGLLQAERDRARVFAGKARPHFLRAVPAYVEKSLAALGQISEGNFAAARALLDEAEEERPPLSGKRGEAAFGDLRDFDDVLRRRRRDGLPGEVHLVPAGAGEEPRAEPAEEAPGPDLARGPHHGGRRDERRRLPLRPLPGVLRPRRRPREAGADDRLEDASRTTSRPAWASGRSSSTTRT